MTINEAILKVMADSGRPMTPTEAFEQIVSKHLYKFRAQEPLSVVRQQMRRHCKDVEFPSAVAKKYYGLTDDKRFYPLKRPIKVSKSDTSPRLKNTLSTSPSKMTIGSSLHEIRKLQSLHKELLKEKLLSDLKKMPPQSFEHFSKQLLDVYGFESLTVTNPTNDGGIDGYGKLKVGLAHLNVAFQCKRWTKGNVGRPEIDRFRGAIQGSFEQGIFFTTAKFAPKAEEASFKSGAVPIILIDGPSITDLMIEKEFGVQEEQLKVFTYALDTILSE